MLRSFSCHTRPLLNWFHFRVMLLPWWTCGILLRSLYLPEDACSRLFSCPCSAVKHPRLHRESKGLKYVTLFKFFRHRELVQLWTCVGTTSASDLLSSKDCIFWNYSAYTVDFRRLFCSQRPPPTLLCVCMDIYIYIYICVFVCV